MATNWNQPSDYQVTGFLVLNYDEFEARFPKPCNRVNRVLKTHSGCRLLEVVLNRTGEMTIYILPGVSPDTRLSDEVIVRKRTITQSEWNANPDIIVMDAPGARVLPLGREESQYLRNFEFNGPYDFTWPVSPPHNNLAEVFDSTSVDPSSTLMEWKHATRLPKPTAVNLETCHSDIISDMSAHLTTYECGGNPYSPFIRFMARKSLTSKVTVHGIEDTFVSFYANLGQQLLHLMEVSNLHLTHSNTLASHLQALYNCITLGISPLEFHKRTTQELYKSCKLVKHVFNIDMNFRVTPWISFPNTLLLPTRDIEGLSQESFCQAAALTLKMCSIITEVVLTSM